MKRSVVITVEAINESELANSRSLSPEAGAVVQFSGVVRQTEAGAAIVALDYEAFQRMAEHQLGILLDEMEKRWPIESVRLTHRIGTVRVNETSLWVEVVTPHRGEAFTACQWLIEELKRVVPIWKKPVT